MNNSTTTTGTATSTAVDSSMTSGATTSTAGMGTDTDTVLGTGAGSNNGEGDLDNINIHTNTNTGTSSVPTIGMGMNVPPPPLGLGLPQHQNQNQHQNQQHQQLQPRMQTQIQPRRIAPMDSMLARVGGGADEEESRGDDEDGEGGGLDGREVVDDHPLVGGGGLRRASSAGVLGVSPALLPSPLQPRQQSRPRAFESTTSPSSPSFAPAPVPLALAIPTTTGISAGGGRNSAVKGTTSPRPRPHSIHVSEPSDEGARQTVLASSEYAGYNDAGSSPTATSYSHNNTTTGTNTSNNNPAYLLPPNFTSSSRRASASSILIGSGSAGNSNTTSACSSARSSRSNTPLPSRSTSPLPEFSSAPGPPPLQPLLSSSRQGSRYGLRSGLPHPYPHPHETTTSIATGARSPSALSGTSSCTTSDTDDGDEPSPLLGGGSSNGGYHHHHRHAHHRRRERERSRDRERERDRDRGERGERERYSYRWWRSSGSSRSRDTSPSERERDGRRYHLLGGNSSNYRLNGGGMGGVKRSWWNIADMTGMGGAISLGPTSMNGPGMMMMGGRRSGGSGGSGASGGGGSGGGGRRGRAGGMWPRWRIVKNGKKWMRRLVRHPFFPRQPITIVLSLLLLSIFVLSLTLLIIHILNPDKAPLPWRAYCSMPTTSASFLTSQLEHLTISTSPSSQSSSSSFSSSSSSSSPSSSGGNPHSHAILQSPYAGVLPYSPSPPSPPLEDLPPIGLFVGVFSMDSSFERRNLIRTTWASHARSRDGAGEGDRGRGTSRTIVRFVMGQPRKAWERRIRLEMQLYNDIVILPVPENMNGGKTHTFFSWSALDAWVPPIYEEYLKNHPYYEEGHAVEPLKTSYMNLTGMPPRVLAPHDPSWAWMDKEDSVAAAANRTRLSRTMIKTKRRLGVFFENADEEVGATAAVGDVGEMKMWVRPDFVVKVDDDAFVMLAELEARLRKEFYAGTAKGVTTPGQDDGKSTRDVGVSSMEDSSSTTSTGPRTPLPPPSTPSHDDQQPQPSHIHDPLIYWGYLVKNRHNTFMAGELYGLSWALTDWVSKSPLVKTMTKGAEDKQTAKWMKAYPGYGSSGHHAGGGSGSGSVGEEEKKREVRWVSERCWIYDHPRSGTVYSHGFLFPSEVARVKAKLKSFFEFPSLKAPTPHKQKPLSSSTLSPPSSTINSSFNPFDSVGDESDVDIDDLTHPHPQPFSPAFTNITTALGSNTPPSWAYSTVSTWGQRYSPPLPSLTIPQSVEALIEGSAMSQLHEGSAMSPEHAWTHREGRLRQYEGRRVGGTVVVHFIKQNMWFEETALAMLEGEEVSETERLMMRNGGGAGLVGRRGRGFGRGGGKRGVEEEGIRGDYQLWRNAHTRRAKRIVRDSVEES